MLLQVDLMSRANLARLGKRPRATRRLRGWQEHIRRRRLFESGGRARMLDVAAANVSPRSIVVLAISANAACEQESGKAAVAPAWRTAGRPPRRSHDHDPSPFSLWRYRYRGGICR